MRFAYTSAAYTFIVGRLAGTIIRDLGGYLTGVFRRAMNEQPIRRTHMNEVPHPPIVSRDRWLDARKKLLAQEKELTRQYDRVNAERRRLPMVRIEKNYRFEGSGGVLSLKDLFEGRRQLVVYHFMFDPAWEKGCPGCTSYATSIGDLGMLHKCDTNFVMVSRAPLSKLEAYKVRQGWLLPWVSSFGSDFNYDFHVTNDETVAPVEYNYRNKAELEANKVANAISGEEHGLSVFFRIGDEVFHTYSAYARGTEALRDSRALLDMTPYGRQQDFEDSPPGWPQKPTYG
jgi:predicted dithiol-disulfide oxidoreductase (DUF899 family)